MDASALNSAPLIKLVESASVSTLPVLSASNSSLMSLMFLPCLPLSPPLPVPCRPERLFLYYLPVMHRPRRLFIRLYLSSIGQVGHFEPSVTTALEALVLQSCLKSVLCVLLCCLSRALWIRLGLLVRLLCPGMSTRLELPNP